MMRHRLSISGIASAAALILVLSACSSSDSSETAAADTTAPAATEAPDTGSETTAPPATEAPATETTVAPADEASTEGTPDELCTAIDEFEMAIDAIDGDDVETIQAQMDAARVEFDEVRDIAGDEHQEELDTMAAAMEEFQAQLAEAAGGDLLEGILGMADALAELAVAGEVLDEQIDCPPDFNDGDAAAEEELDAELDAEEEELEAELEAELDD